MFIRQITDCFQFYDDLLVAQEVRNILALQSAAFVLQQ